MNMKTINITLFSTFLIIFTAINNSYSTPWIKEKNNHIIPDFTQSDVNHIDQGSNICTATAYANSLWFFDATDWSGLVDHPAGKWQKDSESLILHLADEIYGNKEKKKKAYGSVGVIRYIKDHNMYYCQRPIGLIHTIDQAPSYSKIKTELQRCEDVILRMQAYKADGTKIDVNVWTHDVTASGFDESDGKKKILIANPWQPSHKEESSPENKNFFDEIEINIVNNKIRITDSDIINRIDPKLQVAYVQIDEMYHISPKEKKTKIRDGKISRPGGKAQYWYEIENQEADYISEFALEIHVPFDIDSITSPIGWEWEPLYPDLVPHLFPSPGHNEPYIWEPSWTGIYWYTDTDLIEYGETLGGFSFEYDDLPIYFESSHVALSSIYYGQAGFSEHYITSGPSIVPEPSICLLLFIGLVGMVGFKKKIS